MSFPILDPAIGILCLDQTFTFLLIKICGPVLCPEMTVAKDNPLLSTLNDQNPPAFIRQIPSLSFWYLYYTLIFLCTKPLSSIFLFSGIRSILWDPIDLLPLLHKLRSRLCFMSSAANTFAHSKKRGGPCRRTGPSSSLSKPSCARPRDF